MTWPSPTSDIDRARGIVRKPIDSDCLLNNELHPSVADRLERVRDLPVTGVANLNAVERDPDGSIWLIWQYLDGVTLEQYLSQPRDAVEIERITHELKMIVEAIHAHGIVHGAIHANNVIIDPDGRLRLTHISPLLYVDPEQDLEAIEELFKPFKPPPTDDSISQPEDDLKDRWFRVRSYLAALLSLIAGVVIFLTILWYIRA